MTLSDFAYNVRIFLKLGGLFVGLVLLAYVAIIVLLSVAKGGRGGGSMQAQIPATQTAFGQLPPLVVERARAPQKLSFVLDTIDNALPAATTSAAIYFFPEGTITFTSTKQAATLAKKFGFDETIAPIRVDDALTRYEDTTKELIINQKNFHYQYRLKASPALQQLIEATPSAQVELLEEGFTSKARTAFMDYGSYGTSLAGGKTNVTYLTYDLGQQTFVPVKNGEQPQAMRIDFFRENLGTFPAVSPTYFTSQNYAILAPLNENVQIIEMQYRSYQTLAEGEKAPGTTYPGSYPLVTIDEAWKALEAGKVHTISIADNPTTPIKIRDIFVAYYDPESYQKYYQPVYVFLGSDNYVGYLPAVATPYVLGAGK